MTTEPAVRESISTEERDALRESIGALLKQRGGSAALRTSLSRTPRIDRGLWQTLSAEIGVTALPIPEEFGGAGASFVETAVVLEELGGSLSVVPVYSAALASAALLTAGDDAASARLLPAIAAGTSIVALCWAAPSGWSSSGVRAEAGLLSGTAHYVLDAESADRLLVVAGTDAGLTVHDVDAHAEGVTITAQPLLDPTRPLASVTFDDVPAETITARAGTIDAIRTAAWALMSAEQVGGAARALDLTVGYSKEREQFGRAIGSFQALKHRMAEMYAHVATSRAISRAAVYALASGSADAAHLAAAARVHCSEAYSSVVGDAIQIHGGIGITWEHDIHLYFKRAQSSSQLFGQPHEVVADMVARLRGHVPTVLPTGP
ncbi:acyl-CoA dehydrogenase [Gordonia oryzae]|uniref:Acyl-CoA dehydrogenase n=1 Tax=Gordonia oryzae TaxID=2487349 RepID=A0A3N4GB53_9ACTN|nr:acyl-CoA dehydrogenase family protein [Gordonia oryzae]RPA59982.1 acyl-CoA dehydrogenase [Gordonia oryzae]